jgi:D-glucosaminate-6-phosphate ammonia-lyase
MTSVGKNSTIYDRLGIETIVNAKGTSTRLSGAVIDPEVAAAMAEASQHCVDMLELHSRASEFIAEATGAESGLVTSGAAAALLLGTAASMAGLDVAKMERLPVARGMPNEVIVPINQRNVYNRSVQMAGATIVEAGLSDRFAGAGVRDVEAWEIEAAITENTAAILYLARPRQEPPLHQVIALAHKHKVQLIVDAASQLPPGENLRRFIAEGADLVCFSGGKVLRGPQASGILCGRRDLIASAALQMLDHDLPFAAFNPPTKFIDKKKIVGLPRNGVGRVCKVGKEEIVGLLVALQRFVNTDENSRLATWRKLAEELLFEVSGVRHITSALVSSSYKPGIPGVQISFDEQSAGMSTAELIDHLERDEPRIYIDIRDSANATIILAPVSLRAGDARLIGQKFRAILGVA